MKTTLNVASKFGLLALTVFLAGSIDVVARPHGHSFGRSGFGDFHGGHGRGGGRSFGHGHHSGFGRSHHFGRQYHFQGFNFGSFNNYSPFSHFGLHGWGRSNFGYGHYGYLPGYGYQIYRTPLPVDDSGYYPQKVYVYHTPDYGDDVEGGTRAAAWQHLAAGQTIEASGIFAAMERQLPGKGWPKIGAGMIAGFSGNYRRAQYHFQRGFRFDPDGPGHFPDDPNLREKLTAMVEHYREVVGRSKKDEEAEFMLAASAYLAGDYPTAYAAIQSAIAHGDDSRSARNLKSLIDQAGTRLAQADQ